MRGNRVNFQFVTSPSNARAYHPPYYFLHLAAYLRKIGFRVSIIDPKGMDRPRNMKEHFQYIRNRIYYSKADYTGIAAFHSDYPMVMELARVIKDADPHTSLIVGNCHATLMPEDFIYPGSLFDYAILGEGEHTLEELINAERKSVAKEPKGLALLGPDGQMFKTGVRPFMDLADLPLPAYDLVNMDYYTQPQKFIMRRLYTSMVCVFAGRGCPYDCDFCAANNVWKANKGKAARLRPVDNVLDEIWYLKNREFVDFVYLFDDMFGMSKKWMADFFYKYGNSAFGYGKLPPYACQTRADVATEEMIRGLKETGCIQLDIGVEAGDQWLLDKVNKKITLDQIRRVFSWCRKYKIRSFATMLLNLPGETIGSLERTYKFLEEIKPTAGVIFGVTTPYPGTAIYRDHFSPKLKKEEYGLLINNRWNPIERFRMASHDLDLEKLWDQWNMHFLVTPMFERMWAMKPFQGRYWKAFWESRKKRSYVWCWMKDIPKTFILWWMHRLGIYRFAKKIQYGAKWDGDK